MVRLVGPSQWGPGALELVGPCLAIFGFFALVGLSVSAAMAAMGRALPRGFGTLVGVGLGVGLPILTVAHWLRVDFRLTIIFLALASTAIVVTSFVRQRVRGSRLAEGHTGQAPIAAGPDAIDLAALVVGLVVLLPMLRFGATSWALDSNDGPNYFASAQIWLSGDGTGSAFAERHPDFFGDFQLARAVFEKPMVTSLYAVSDLVSGMPVYRLLTPVLAVALFVLVHSLLRITIGLFGLSLSWALLCAVPPVMSVVFVSRVHEAQTGQVVAVALLAQTLHLLSAVRGDLAGLPRGIVVVVAALTASAALGANATVVLAAAPAVLALAYLVVRLGGAAWQASATLLAGVAAAAVVFSVPFVPWYTESLALQAPDLPGLSVDDQSPFAGLFMQGSTLGLPTPLAAIGLEPSHAPSAGVSSLAFASWGFVLAVLILWALARVRSGRPPMAALMGFLAVAALNATIVAVASGIGGYGLYKWMGVLIPLAVPLVLACWASSSAFVTRRPRWLVGLGSAVVVVSTSMAFAGGFQIGERGYVASHDLLALGADPDLASREYVNIDTGNWKDDATAAVIVPSERVIVTRRTYPPGAAAVGPVYLVGSAKELRTGDWWGTGVASLEETRRDAPPVPAGFDFSATQASDSLVLGDGYRPVGSESLATAHYSTVTLDAESAPDGVGCVVLSGSPFVDPAEPLEMSVTVGGVRGVQRRFTSGAATQLAVPVPPEANGGRLVIEIETSAPYTRGSLGYQEPGRSGFGLQRLVVQSAPCPRGFSGLIPDLVE